MALCLRSDLNLFERQAVDYSVQSEQFVIFDPVTSLNANTQILFDLPASEHYTNLSECYIELWAHIEHADGTPLDPVLMNNGEYQQGPRVSVINNPIASFFASVEVQIQNKTISKTNSDLYGFQGYIESLLSYPRTAQDTILKAGLFTRDTYDRINSPDPWLDEARVNKGLRERAEHFVESKQVHLFGKVHTDLSGLDRLLPNQLNIKFRFVKAKNEFSIMTDDPAPNYQIKFDRARLHVCRVNVTPSVGLAIEKTLRSGKPLCYPFSKTEMMTFQMNPGARVYSTEGLFQNRVPSRIICGMVSDRALAGSYRDNPYNFNKYSLNMIKVTLDGVPVAHALPLDFESPASYMGGYLSLASTQAATFSRLDLPISYQEYLEGFTLFQFLLNASCEAHASPAKFGNLRIELKFQEFLPHNANLVILAEFGAELQLNQNREPIVI